MSQPPDGLFDEPDPHIGAQARSGVPHGDQDPATRGNDREPAMQMRLDFGPPRIQVEVTARLSGLWVVLDSAHNDLLAEYLRSAGVEFRSGEWGVKVQAKDLSWLRRLPSQVRIHPDDAFRALHVLALHPPDPADPASLVLANGFLWLRWYDGESFHDEQLSATAAPAFVTADIPFIATHEAMGHLGQSTHLPVRIARCALSPENYIEMVSAKPQSLEAVPLPGLFRLEPTRYGVPLAYLEQVRSAPGLEWVGQVPAVTHPGMPDLPLTLSRHHHIDLPRVTSVLATTGGVMLAWSPGLGRRVMALAAVEAVEGWPILVVSAPSGAWAWHRLVALFGRRLSVHEETTDARLVTYADLALGVKVYPTPTIIFDDVTGHEAASPAARSGIRRLDGYSQAYRIGLAPTWPSSLEEACHAMDAVRPGEFRLDGSQLALRYPAPSERRALEHLSAYLFVRRSSDRDTELSQRFRHSQVRTVAPSQAELEFHELAQGRLIAGEDPLCILEDVLEVVSAGPPQRLSKKVGAAITVIRQAVAKDRRVLVLTRHVRTQRMLRAGLSGVRSTVGEVPGSGVVIGPAQVVVLRWSEILRGPLPDADEVLVCDYPWSFAELDAALGPPTGPGPALISILHAPGTIDDRVAMYAASRAEEEPTGLECSQPSPEMAKWLLRPRGL